MLAPVPRQHGFDARPYNSIRCYRSAFSCAHLLPYIQCVGLLSTKLVAIPTLTQANLPLQLRVHRRALGCNPQLLVPLYFTLVLHLASCPKTCVGGCLDGHFRRPRNQLPLWLRRRDIYLFGVVGISSIYIHELY